MLDKREEGGLTKTQPIIDTCNELENNKPEEANNITKAA